MPMQNRAQAISNISITSWEHYQHTQSSFWHQLTLLVINTKLLRTHWEEVLTGAGGGRRQWKAPVAEGLGAARGPAQREPGDGGRPGGGGRGGDNGLPRRRRCVLCVSGACLCVRRGGGQRTLNRNGLPSARDLALGKHRGHSANPFCFFSNFQTLENCRTVRGGAG